MNIDFKAAFFQTQVQQAVSVENGDLKLYDIGGKE